MQHVIYSFANALCYVCLTRLCAIRQHEPEIPKE